MLEWKNYELVVLLPFKYLDQQKSQSLEFIILNYLRKHKKINNKINVVSYLGFLDSEEIDYLINNIVENSII